MIKNKGTKKEAGKKPLELYIHIPFCIRKCAYCDFLSAPAAPEVQEAYVGQLLQEIAASKKLPEDYEAVTVFFGGGTPGILKGELLCSILRALRDRFSVREDAEITVEANPGTVNRDKLVQYREAGVNRISLGLQSADNQELKLLGRIHTWEQFLESFQLARETGFRNINVDLMSALPGQTTESVHRTLERVLALSPEHISAYSLILEEGTPFHKRYEGHPELLPSEEEERQMYYDTRDRLCACGYEHYEISNFAKPGYACRHNLGYWERTDYKGFGLGAASLLKNVRHTNQTDLTEYLKGNFAGTEDPLTEQAVREEYFFLGLRKMEGVEPGRYREHYEERIQRLQAQQLLEEKDGRIRLTERGTDVSNYVMAQFLD
ncbi:MAG: radical SAM family heme chaperone HemW [Lachnospiraceae bacterium]|jgi:oxygen-independent coproporphyrinogen-3 oxidase|nr:radical SAM family heme chaperone HemW [Lachnospiraceae bacterium]MCI9600264.1 radical SAM family heme chaperone HemW [Lachnospiraceae bacterium]